MSTTIYGGLSGADAVTLGAIAGTSLTGTSQVTTSTHLAAYNVLSAEAVVTCSGATSTASNLIPAGATLTGFASRVVTTVTSGDGATSFTIGDGTTANLYCTGCNFGSANFTGSGQYATPLTPLAPASRNVVLTASGGTFSGGTVRCVVFYTTTSGPTS